MKITKILVPQNKYSIKCPYSMNPSRIVVHNTANDASALNEIKYMIKNNNEISFHYAVDDKEIIQGVEENRNAWHAGDGNGLGNREGIAIEICYSKSGGEKYEKAENNAILLIVDILNRYNWDISKVTKHEDYSGKYCPHRILDNGWDNFLNKIEKKLNESRIKPFSLFSKVINIDDVILYESAGYGGKKIKLPKGTVSIVKKYFFNKKLYMALGDKTNFYEAAWTCEINNFKAYNDSNVNNERNNINNNSTAKIENIPNKSFNFSDLIKDVVKFFLDILKNFIYKFFNKM